MNSRDFRVLFLYEWKSKHNAVAAGRNIKASFGSSSVNKCTIRDWYAKFETEDGSFTKKDRGKPEIVVDSEILWAIVEKNPGNTIKDYAEELSVSPTPISYHLKMIGIKFFKKRKR